MRAWSGAIGASAFPLSCSTTCDRSGEGRAFSSCLFLHRFGWGDGLLVTTGSKKRRWVSLRRPFAKAAGQSASFVPVRRVGRRARGFRIDRGEGGFPPPFQRLLNIEHWHLWGGGAWESACQRWVEWARRALAPKPFCSAVAVSAERDKVPSPDASQFSDAPVCKLSSCWKCSPARLRHCFPIHIPKDTYQHFHGRLKAICLQLSVQLYNEGNELRILSSISILERKIDTNLNMYMESTFVFFFLQFFSITWR